MGTREPGSVLEEGSDPPLGASFVGNAYRECLENGTWASRINYSQCEPILDDKVSGSHLPHPWSCTGSRTQSTEDAKGGRTSPVSPTHPFLAPLATTLCPLACEKGT